MKKILEKISSAKSNSKEGSEIRYKILNGKRFPLCDYREDCNNHPGNCNNKEPMLKFTLIL